MKIELTGANFLSLQELGELAARLDVIHEKTLKAIDRLQGEVEAQKARIANHWRGVAALGVGMGLGGIVAGIGVPPTGGSGAAFGAGPGREPGPSGGMGGPGAAETAAAGALTCASCQAPNAPGSKFCASCGKPLAPRAAHCTQCGATAAPGAKFCGRHCNIAMVSCTMLVPSGNSTPSQVSFTR